jgi:site-specific DNA recombinase
MAQHTHTWGTKKAILYARVSTEEQGKRGYSLAQQLEALREHAAGEGYEVLEEVSDRAQSGVSLERAGMDRVRDLVAEGGVHVVLAQDADRITRDPAHRAFLDDEMGRLGTRLVALDDWGDDSHEGELLKYMKGWVSKGESLKTAERTRRGKLRKAREGKIIAGATPNYGFRYNAARDGYEVDEATMAVVRRVFRMVGAEGASLHAVQRSLEHEGIRAPKGGPYWSRSFLRRLLLEEVYKPHAFEELAPLVSPEVAARLDGRGGHGVWWFNRRRVVGRGRGRRSSEEKPREEWVAVPVPDAGVPRGWVDAAREAIKDNYRPKSKNHRYWELTGGILRCGECGRRMIGHSMTTNRGGKKRTYYYYVCPKKGLEHIRACRNKNHRAEPLEGKVMDAVADLLNDPSRLARQIRERIQRERDAAADPHEEIKALQERLEGLGAMRRSYQYQQAAGLMTLEELGLRLSELDEAREALRRDLETVHNRREHIEALETHRHILLGLYMGYTTGGLGIFRPEERRRIYGALGLAVSASENGDVEIRGTFESDIYPAEERTMEVIAEIRSRPEMRAMREACRLKREGKAAEHRQDVMPTKTASTSSASSTPRTPPSRR